MSSPPSLQDLPNEILDVIFSKGTLSFRDLHSLSLTCRRNAQIAKPYLYRSISTGDLSRGPQAPSRRSGRGVSVYVYPRVGRLISTLYRRPEHLGLIKKIKVHSGYSLDVVNTKEPAWEDMKSAAAELSFPEHLADNSTGSDYTRLTSALLIWVCKDVQELESEYDQYGWLDMVKDSMTSKSTDVPFHGFPKLERFSFVGGKAIGARYGEEEVEFEAVTFLMKAPALRRFEVVAAGNHNDYILADEDTFKRQKVTEGIERGSSKVQELIFEECVLPVFSVGDTALACESLTELGVTWAAGPHYFFLIFSDLCEALARHKNTLKKLVLDVSKVLYFDWDTFTKEHLVTMGKSLEEAPPGVEINYTLPSYEGIGSLKDFPQLRHLEISACMLGRVSLVAEVEEMLPLSLETVVFLPPVQHGQPSIDELVRGIKGATTRSA